MKRFFSVFVSGLILLSFFSCQDKDKVAPHILLKGPNPYYITLNDNYIEYYFEIFDNRDDSASLEVEIINELDTLVGEYYNATGGDILMGEGSTIQTGEFIIQYIVKDKAGNKTIAERTVIVQNSLEKFAREYAVQKVNLSVPEDIYPDYTTNIEFDENVNNRIWFPRFSNIEFYSLNVYADVVGNDVYIPYQAFPDKDNYFIQGIDDENNGLAGTIDRTNYKFDLTFTASSFNTGTQEFNEKYTKL